jgi:LPS-assembly protein
MSIRIGASRIGPRVEEANARRGRQPLPRLAGILAAVLCGCLLSSPLQAQTSSPSEHDAQKAAVKQANGRSDMLVEAKEMVYDKDHNTVSAVGNAKI